LVGLTKRDTRSTKEPVYTHSSTHSDDITHLSLLPSTSTYLPRSANRSLPDQLLLSASTDGLVALSDLKESDEDEAVQSAENFGQSIAQAGYYEHKGKMRVWGRSDMDAVGIWSIGKGEEDDIEVCFSYIGKKADTDDIAARPGCSRYGKVQV